MGSNLAIPGQRIFFANYSAVRQGWVSRHAPYLLVCRFYHCAIIDRTKTLDLGFEAAVLDPIEEALAGDDGGADFASLCDRRAQQLVDEAAARNRRLVVLWSGGIDSTVALVALIRACRRRRGPAPLRVLLSDESIAEYPVFFERVIRPRLEYVPLSGPLPACLSPEALIVTGEHGDQLFGSDRLKEHVESGSAYFPWKTVLPLLLGDAGLDHGQGDDVVEYLAPLMGCCPRRVETLFDFFWWLNFTLKWQSVTLRIAANAPGDVRKVHLATRHFFRTADFQRWSVFRHDRPRLDHWREYKMPAKQYIYDFTGDADYQRTKEKEQSLRLVFGGENTDSGETGAGRFSAGPILLDDRFQHVAPGEGQLQRGLSNA